MIPSFYAIKDDLVNASATYLDQEVVVDGNLITSRTPDDLPAFCRAIIEVLGGKRLGRGVGSSRPCPEPWVKPSRNLVEERCIVHRAGVSVPCIEWILKFAMRKAILVLFALAITVSACGQVEPTSTAVPSPSPASLALTPRRGQPTPVPRTTPLPKDLIHQDPALVDNSGFEITPVEGLHTTGRPVDIDIDEYRLVVDGLVENPLSLSYENLLARPSATEVVLLICPGFFADNAEWTGVTMADILEEARVKPEAKQVVFHATDGSYKRDLPLEEAMNEGVFLAYRVNGQVLPSEHGYPLRLVARGQYGDRWVKWLKHIEVK